LEARSLWATNNINDKVQRVRFAKTSDPKKIAEGSGGVVAQDGLGVDPGLPRGGKAQDEIILKPRGIADFSSYVREKKEILQASEDKDGIDEGGAAGKGGRGVGGDSEANKEGSDVAQGNSVGGGKPQVNMQLLRNICAGNIPAKLMEDSYDAESRLAEKSAEPIEIDLCGFKSFNDVDGENYICGKEKHGPKIQHGEWIKV
jgi:hypothetical protein